MKIEGSTKNFAVIALTTLGIWVLSPAAKADTFTLNPANGHYYGFVSGSLDWQQANSAAASQQFMGFSGYLATITSASEESFIQTHFSSDFTTLPSTTPLWLGGYQPANSTEPAGGWTWVTGESFTYSNWASGEPNNNTEMGNEDALEIWGTGVWNDTSHTRTGSGYLVEFSVPEPSSLGLALSALGAIAIFRKRMAN
jgi:hypothetical protein